MYLHIATVQLLTNLTYNECNTIGYYHYHDSTQISLSSIPNTIIIIHSYILSPGPVTLRFQV